MDAGAGTDDSTVGDVVRRHYGGSDFEHRVLAALAERGVDTDHLTGDDLAVADQLHAGGLPATEHLLESLHLGPNTRLLDVGCGIGGPARVAAARYSCRVVGLDLSPDFIRAATELTGRAGLAHLVEHEVASVEHTDLPDASFDRAMLVHVGMNLPDKAAVFAEVRRVLRPGGLFGLYEQMRTGTGTPRYPLPWAEDERSSFLAAPTEYAAILEAAGFTVEEQENRTAAMAGGSDAPPDLGPAAVFGASFADRFANNVAATRAGLVQPVVMVARAT